MFQQQSTLTKVLDVSDCTCQLAFNKFRAAHWDSQNFKAIRRRRWINMSDLRQIGMRYLRARRQQKRFAKVQRQANAWESRAQFSQKLFQFIQYRVGIAIVQVEGTPRIWLCL